MYIYKIGKVKDLRIIQEDWTSMYDEHRIQRHRRKRKVRNLNSTLMEIVQVTTPEKTVRVHESDKP